MTNCNIASHHHGMKLSKGQIECVSKDGTTHLFNGHPVQLKDHVLPLYPCSRCGYVAAYYQCNGSEK